MKPIRRRRWLAPVAAVAMALIAGSGAASAARADSSTASETTLHFTGLRDYRYCEVFLITQTATGVSVRVSNTTHVDPCTDKEWNALDPVKVAKEYGVDAVYKNGPRYCVLDQVVVRGADPKAQSFADVQALGWGGFTASGGAQPAPYTATTIDRDTQWWYRQGQLVYQLIDPDGKSYVLQAYSRIVDKNMKMSDLMNLDSRLKLPTGWEYRISILDSNLSLPSVDKKATITQDEFQDTYMLATDIDGNPIRVP